MMVSWEKGVELGRVLEEEWDSGSTVTAYSLLWGCLWVGSSSGGSILQFSLRDACGTWVLLWGGGEKWSFY